MKNRDRELNDRAIAAVAEMSSRLEEKEFIDPGGFSSLSNGYAQLDSDIRRKMGKLTSALGLINKELKKNLNAFREIYDDYPGLLRKHNEELLRSESVEVGKLINPLEGYDLDEQQLAAIAYDVRSRLVIAGAGTGKTTTTVGLVKHLLRSGKALPEEILALSFTNASVDDLRKRIIAEAGQRVDVYTFHRLGLKIIASAEGTVPKVSKIKVDEFIAEEIRRRKGDARFMRNLNEYIAYEFESVKDEDRFEDSSELIEYLKENSLITLKGERVKSFGEADIANYLAMNGVPYTYEGSYRVDTADSRYGQYHPDFHIDGTDIYIEYFGTDRNGNVAKFMIDRDPNAAEEYKSGIEWKRQTHRKNGTHLIELYAYERSEGTIFDKLESELRSSGIVFAPEPPESIFDRAVRSDGKMLRSLAMSFATAILLIKGFGKPWDEVYPKPDRLSDRRSLKRMEAVLKPIYEAYQSALEKNGEIDFEDMLNMAASRVREGKFLHPYKYVIVDEYQDLSRSRYNLLSALRRSKDYRLFCVGDDWQSIYRFNGCDVSYILDFERYWGPSAICKIERTYRFSGDILRKSSEFVCRNSRQIRKNLVGMGGKDSKVYFISKDDDIQIREEIGRRLVLLENGKSVLFLGRYNHDVRLLSGGGFGWKQNISDSSKTISYDPRPDLDMKFMTIHSSKGLQADVVFSVNNRSGRYGFPSIREEPAVIQMLLVGENSQIDEERRLFYVAMTRAKEAVYIVSQNGHQSDFFKEMFPMGNVYGKKEGMTCPLCGGAMILKTNQNGHRFYGCSNYRSKGCRFTRDCEPFAHPKK
jgi:DNA helicase-4